MKSPKVSVVIPTYNHVKYIREALLSVMNQTYRNIEIIVCDDGSTDGAEGIIRQLADTDSRIVPLFSSENRGLSLNINRGLDRCSGVYTAIMSGDDMMFSNKVVKQVDFLEGHPDYHVCLHPLEVFDSIASKKLYDQPTELIVRTPTEWFFQPNWLFKPYRIYPASSILSRSSYLLAARFDPRLRYKNEVLFAIDQYMAVPNAKWHVIPEVLGRYRIHSHNMHLSWEMNEALLEETYLLYGIVSSRYPQLSGKIKDVKDIFLFNSLLFNWFPIEKRRELEDLFRNEAGLWKWLYLKCCRWGLSHKLLMDVTRPLRVALKRIYSE